MNLRLPCAKAPEILKDLYLYERKGLLKILSSLSSKLKFLMGTKENFCPFRL